MSSVPVGTLKSGDEFVTCLTGRAGTVLDVRKSRGAEVVLEASPVGEVRWMHPEVRVEVLK